MTKITENLPSKRSRSIRLAVCAALLWAGAPALAETVAIPLGQQGRAWQVEAPRHGLNKAQVEAEFGEPLAKSGPVGDPPIYTWEYDRFNVYFEGDYVIHSVVKYQPQQAQP